MNGALHCVRKAYVPSIPHWQFFVLAFFTLGAALLQALVDTWIELSGGSADMEKAPRLNVTVVALAIPAAAVFVAAVLACAFAAAAEAYRACRWPRAVRVKRDGAVLEPASGTFNVTVAPGQPVQEAVDGCPPGGSMLLLPGMHAGPLELAAGKEVHVFGRGLATLQSSGGAVVTSKTAVATLDGLIVRHEANVTDEDGGQGADAVLIEGGNLRLQACDVTNATWTSCVSIVGGANPVLTRCTCAHTPTGSLLLQSRPVDDHERGRRRIPRAQTKEGPAASS